MYYVTYDLGDAGTLRQLTYTGNRTPVAVASADHYYGPGPLTVQFTGSGSSDPDGQSITYSWNFGDGTPVGTAPNPAHTFTAPGGSMATNYLVTLTVTDSGGLPASATLNIALNDTPPNVAITSPTNAMLYTMESNSTFNLTASVTDAENPTTSCNINGSQFCIITTTTTSSARPPIIRVRCCWNRSGATDKHVLLSRDTHRHRSFGAGDGARSGPLSGLRRNGHAAHDFRTSRIRPRA